MSVELDLEGPREVFFQKLKNAPCLKNTFHRNQNEKRNFCSEFFFLVSCLGGVRAQARVRPDQRQILTRAAILIFKRLVLFRLSRNRS